MDGLAATPDEPAIMACDPTRLNVIGYASGFTLWHYADQPAARRAPPDLLAPGYFDAARDLLRPGDFLFANGRARHAILVVLAAGSSGVILSALASTGAIAPAVREAANPAAALGS